MNPIESDLKRLIVRLLGLTGEAREELHASARETRNTEAGKRIAMRAVVEASNVCRANCTYCPMRRDNLGKSIVPTRLTANQIVDAATSAHDAGIRNLFIQSG